MTLNLKRNSFDDELQSIEFLLFSHPVKPKQCDPFCGIVGISCNHLFWLCSLSSSFYCLRRFPFFLFDRMSNTNGLFTFSVFFTNSALRMQNAVHLLLLNHEKNRLFSRVSPEDKGNSSRKRVPSLL